MFEKSEISAYDTLRVFSDKCDNHKFKDYPMTENQKPTIIVKKHSDQIRVILFAVIGAILIYVLYRCTEQNRITYKKTKRLI